MSSGVIGRYGCDDFFTYAATRFTALTFADVQLNTETSQFSPQEVNITGWFTNKIELSTPFASAAMDTVTTAPMAIAMAKLGGIGVIHPSLSPERQKAELVRVKRYLHSLIDDPITVSSSMTLGEVLRTCEERDFSFRTFPVIDATGKLQGLLTQNDFDRYAGLTAIRVAQAMTPAEEVIKASKGTDIKTAYKLMMQHRRKTLPLVDTDGRLVGLYLQSDVQRNIYENPSGYNLDSAGRLRAAIAVTTGEGSLERIQKMHKYLDVVVIDTAQGDSKFTFDTLQKIKSSFSGIQVVVGNITSARSARLLAEAGADGIKVGQGSGSICTTRTQTGIGCPQLTAVWRCARAVRDLGVPIISDGGVREPGDIPKVLAAGASAVMMGSILAKTEEAPGDIVYESGQRWKSYRGMGSRDALEYNAASRERYQQSGNGVLLPEGVSSLVPLLGSVEDVIGEYRAGLRKSMSYVGAENLSDLQQNTTFIRNTNAGIIEASPHDVRVIR